MQNAKDTFYEVLRGRIAAANPERTVVLRGVVRPGVLVEENELLSAIAQPDCFRLRWTGASVDSNGAMPVVAMRCEVLYETAGTALNAGMDRGRALATMDAELMAAVHVAPQHAVKTDYAGLSSNKTAVMMDTNVWWSDVVFGDATVNDDRLTRTATVDVFACQEAGEL